MNRRIGELQQHLALRLEKLRGSGSLLGRARHAG